MILILTTSNDWSTFEVIDWIGYFNKEYQIINELVDVELEKFVFDNNNETSIILKIDNTEFVESRLITSYWYRRHGFNVSPIYPEDYISHKAYQHLCYERDAINDFINYYLDRKNSISSYNTQNINKLMCLDIAKKVGLLIPNTIIATTKAQVDSFNKHNKKSTKAIQEAILYTENDYLYFNYNNFLTKDTVSQLPITFFPSLIQEYIEKKIELRIFYLNEKCYSMAIFSQQNKKTKVDFRRYDHERPNRNVPYNLPKHIERKIIRFMKTVDLNSGSIDMILTTDNQYVFLEVNPIGQFGFVSKSCNYYLEKEIADFLK